MNVKHNTRNSEPSLWEQALQLWRDLVLGFGHPLDLVRWIFIRRLDHRAIGHRICDLEALVRRAIRADAGELDPSELKLAPARQRRTKPPSRPDKPRSPSHQDDPRDWKISFRMTPAALRTGPRPSRAGKPRPEPRERRNAIPYALRIEALRRVIYFPKDYVLRHARRLARRAEQEASRLARTEERHSAVQALCVSLQEEYGLPVNAETPPSIEPRNAKNEEPG
jgi:hypothetical protein